MKTAKPALFGTKKPRAKPVDREGLEQAALMAEVRLRYPDAAKLLYHVPNGGHRVKAGLSAGGIELAGAEVPPGEHQIRVTVQDSEGRQSSTVLQLNVVK